jgi:hypothetical protein
MFPWVDIVGNDFHVVGVASGETSASAIRRRPVIAQAAETHVLGSVRQPVEKPRFTPSHRNSRWFSLVKGRSSIMGYLRRPYSGMGSR